MFYGLAGFMALVSLFEQGKYYLLGWFMGCCISIPSTFRVRSSGIGRVVLGIRRLFLSLIGFFKE